VSDMYVVRLVREYLKQHPEEADTPEVNTWCILWADVVMNAPQDWFEDWT